AIGLISTAALLGRILSIPCGIVTAKYLGPSLFGILSVLNIIRQYIGYTHFGLLQSLPRDVPIAYGRGDKKEAELRKNTIFTGFFAISTIGILGLWVLFLFGFTFNSTLNLSRLILISLIFIAGRIHSFLVAYVKGEGKFIVIGRLDMIYKIIFPVLTIPAAILFKLTGVLFTTFLAEAIAVGYAVMSLTNLKFHLYFEIKKTFILLKTGFLIFINKISDNLLLSIGVILLTSMTSAKFVGLYTMALGIVMAKKVPFAQAVGMTVYRKIMIESGKYGTENKYHFRKYAEKYSALFLLFNCLYLGCMILFYMIIIRIFLEEYRESLPLMLILFFGYVIYISRVFPSYYLNVTNQLHKRLFAIFTGACLNAILSYISILKGYGITGVSVACSLSFIIVSVTIISISFKQIYNDAKPFLYYLLKLFLISTVLTAILVFFYNWNFFDYNFIQNTFNKILIGTIDLIIKGLIFSILCFSIFLALFAKYRLINEIKPILFYAGNSIMKIFKIKRKSHYAIEKK
ncbi:hypothetical protein LCGC14_1408720, partial [marine sediment metagenome]